VHPLVDPLAKASVWCSNDEYVTIARQRLGLPLYEGNRSCNMCPSRRHCDELGHHSMACCGGGYRTRFHNSSRDELGRLATAALAGPVLERNVFPGEGRRCDVFLTSLFDNGRPIVCDVVTISPFQRIGAAAAAPGGAAAAAEQRKRDEYASLPPTMTFAPFGVDTFGALGPSAKSLLKRLSHRVSDRLGIARQTALMHLRIEFQAMLFRHVARLLLVNVHGDGSGSGLTAEPPDLATPIPPRVFCDEVDEGVPTPDPSLIARAPLPSASSSDVPDAAGDMEAPD
jgi:hypothetical protein